MRDRHTIAKRVQRTRLGVLATALVAIALVTGGLPATAAQQAKGSLTAPAHPPVTPPPPEPQRASPPPPLPTGPIPALRTAGQEIVERRTERSKTFATEKAGQYRTVLYAERVHFKDAKGAYQEIDADLGPSTEGVRRSKANGFAVEVADQANAASVARIRLDAEVSVGFSFDSAAPAQAKFGKDNDAYDQVAPGVNLRLTSRPDGLKEELILASAAAGDRFVFPLDLRGLTAAIDDDGNVVYRDATGVERARTPHGFMTDAAIDPRSGEAPMSMGVTYALISHGRGTALEVRLDRDWLADPARVWPVVVDPQLVVNTYGDDTYVMSGFHRDNSHDAELKVGTYDGGAHVGRSYVRFDTAAINYKIVNSAQFHIGESHSWNCAAAWPSVHRVTGGWNGGDMQDWPGAPFDGNPAGGVISANGTCGSRTVVYDVTSAAGYWAANPGQSFGLVLETNHSDNNAWKKFKSYETGAPPRLDVTWTAPANDNPIGYLDAVYPFVNGVWPRGWAIDPNSIDPIWLHVYVDGNFVEALVANKSRPDVGAAYPGSGNNHGFEDFAYVSPGYHNVCVYAINTGPGSANPLLGCQGVTVPGRSLQEPFGSLDTVTVAPGGMQVRGWAIDADTVAPITVQVWADLNYVTTINANTSRPDVGAAFPGYGNNHGYDSFVFLSPGYHNVCAFAINTGAGSNNPLLGCRQVTVSAANPPSAPTNAAASVATDRSVTVTWSPSASNGGSPIDLYAIYAYDAPTATYTNRYTVVYMVSCAQTCNSTRFAELPGDRSYYFYVYAHNGSPTNNGFSPAAISNTVLVPPGPTTTTTTAPTTTTTTAPTTTTTTAPTTTTTTTTIPPHRPDAPRNVRAKPGDRSARISWTAPSGNGSDIIRYTVTAMQGGIAGPSVTTPDGNTTAITVGNLVNGKQYSFRVVATNSLDDSDPGESVPVTPPGGFRVLTWNLKLAQRESDMSVIADVILDHSPDIVALQEVGPSPPPVLPYDEGADADAIAAHLTLRDPGNEATPGSVTWRVYRDGTRAILTRNSLANEESWRFANEDRRGFMRIVAAERDFGEQVYVYNTHLSASPPTGGRGEQAQAIVNQIAGDRSAATAAGHPFRAVLLGDFNEQEGDALAIVSAVGMVSAGAALGMPDGGRDGDTYIEADDDGVIQRARLDYVWVGTHTGIRDLSIDSGEIDETAGPDWDDASGGYSDHRPVIFQLSTP